MSADAAIESADVDVSDILQVNVNYGKLSFILSSLLKRVDELEKARDTDTASQDKTDTQQQRVDQPADVTTKSAPADEAVDEAVGSMGDDDAPPEARADDRFDGLEARLQKLEGAAGKGSPDLEPRVHALEKALADLKSDVAASTMKPVEVSAREALAPAPLDAAERTQLEKRLSDLESIAPIVTHPALASTKVELAPVRNDQLRLQTLSDGGVGLVASSVSSPAAGVFTLQQHRQEEWSLVMDGAYLMPSHGKAAMDSAEFRWKLIPISCGYYRLSAPSGDSLLADVDSSSVSVGTGDDDTSIFKFVAVNTLADAVANAATKQDVEDLQRRFGELQSKPAQHDTSAAKQADVDTEGLADLNSRLKALEDRELSPPTSSAVDTSALDATKTRLDALEEAQRALATSLNGLADVPAKIEALGDTASEQRQVLHGLQDKVNLLASQLEALSGLTDGKDGGNSGTSEVTATQFQLLRGTVDGLRQSQDDLRTAFGELESLKSKVEEITAAVATLDGAVNPALSELSDESASHAKRLDDLSARVVELGPEILRVQDGLKKGQEATQHLHDTPTTCFSA